MTTNDLGETLEKLRSIKYTDIDAELIRDVVTAQANYMANPSEAFKRISQAVDVHLNRKEKP